jgi:hypothetical protein
VTFLNSPSEVGRLDVTHLGMWVNVDEARTGDDEALRSLIAHAVDHEVGAEHRAYIEGIADDEGRAAALGLFTVVAHESRHFHDLLLTPYGAAVMSHHVRQAMTLLSSMGSLSSNAAIIVPIAEWSAQLPVLKQLDAELEPPSAKLEALIAVLDETERDLRALDQGIHHPDAPVTATQILETSALWVQLGLAGRTLGMDGANLLMSAIRESPARGRYLGAMDYIHGRLGWLPSAAVQFLLLASLCGDAFSSDPHALRSPADVLVVLTEWLAAHPDFPRPAPTAEFHFDVEFNRIYGMTQEFFGRVWDQDVAGMMDVASDQTYANVAEWQRRIAGKDDGGLTFQWVENALAVYRGFAEVGGSLVANFSMDPEWYFVDGYLDVLPALPRPVTFFWSDHGFAANPELRERFSVQQEIVVPHQEGLRSDPELAQMYASLADNAYDDGQALRLATVISPKGTKRADPPQGALAFIVKDIDVEAWQRYFDAVVPTFRLLTVGPDDGLPGGIMVQPLQVLGLHGTRFYSRAGLLPTPAPFRGAPDPK